MIVEQTDPVNELIEPITGDFDEIWAELGQQIKISLGTFDPNVTWLNLYLSHDGKPSFTRTLVRKDAPPAL